MSWKDIVLRLRALLFRQQMDDELQEELQFRAVVLPIHNDRSVARNFL